MSMWAIGDTICRSVGACGDNRNRIFRDVRSREFGGHPVFPIFDTRPQGTVFSGLVLGGCQTEP